MNVSGISAWAYSGIGVDRIEEGIARFKQFCES